jgi:DNA-binding PadR family transcriptional regulator
MSAVFSHGRLRLYLLRLLDEGPKHGYELIRLLENRFHGLYAPSAGTIYPRLARMEADGLISHTAAGGRKVYDITDAGRAELAARADELARLEADIGASVADLAALAEEVEEGVRGSVRDLKRELRQARHDARPGPAADLRGLLRESLLGPTGRPEPDSPAAEVQRKATGLAAEVARLVGLGRASSEDLRVASTVLDSVRDQLRHILRG